MARARPPYRIEFYRDLTGNEPVRKWLLDEIVQEEATVLGMALRHYLQELGPGVVDTRYGRALGGSLYEFRLDDTVDDVLTHLGFRRKRKLQSAPGRAMLFRVFFHPHGNKVILLLAAYDKGRQPSKAYQQRQITLARKRLAEWMRRDPRG
jgi:hypothetical protein